MNSFFERRYVIAGIFIAIVVVLLARLFYIQIVDPKYAIYAGKNVLRQTIIYPARGPILDRNGKVLVQNEPFYDIMVTPREVKPFDTVEFCKLLGIDKDGFNKRWVKAWKNGPTHESIFEKQLTAQTYASVSERLSEFPGFSAITRYLRNYPDSVAAQFLGYIGEVQPNVIASSGGYYHSGDFIGITGVEKSYENVLRGQRGVSNQMVDSRGRLKGKFANGLYDTAAVPGQRLTSSLDITIQKLGEKLMQNKVGSIVAIEPSTGEILAYVSSPTYNPNLMVGRERGNNSAKMYADVYNPLFVRPVQAKYPPGSSFKPLSALIALQEGIITPQTTYYCPGYFQAGNRRVKCNNGEAHGLVNLSSAVAESCNGYFSMVFQKIIEHNGIKQTEATYTDWRNNVKKFGLGSRLDLDVPGESRGNVPTPLYYDNQYRKGGWRASTILSLAIGQGELLATPLQMANLECTIANHGYYYKPHLVKAIGTKNVIKEEYKLRNYVGIDSGYFEPVINGMQAVVERGTGIRSKIPGIIMCGKTGTAQNHGGEAHSVFVAFAPRENPKIAIAVVVENSGEGAHWAAPIASFIVEQYLRGSISPRESGITVDYFANANRLPDSALYYNRFKRKVSPKDTAKQKADTMKKPIKGLKGASRQNKKDSSTRLLAVLPKRKHDK
ncbi:penicillin-binding protein 2 [Mucilaginibacter sp. BJC16-A38]|uniref:penicillin-binding protein 2 n=1 Tax=Mucilaginibacter phenanthrenivorans TaxID=1234842 RepID=UPI002157A35A|nr:penicillin-binding protein 2 [Mucilaginibacter phenanthrenivorans]MCR8561658.1 penicillin-binding protein 2 [Mucilaginibacter phenanthrenivorans]